MKIEELDNYQLLEAYSDAVKKRHYDPIGDMEVKFKLHECEEEILRRMGEIKE